MTDNELENLYKANINTSHFAGLRGVWDDGFAAGANLSASVAASSDPSASATDTSAAAVATSGITAV